MKMVRLADVCKYRKQFIEIADDVKYKRCRVQLHRKGVLLRDYIQGSKIKTKKQRLCKTNDFIVAEMDAKFGGYGIVPLDLDGAIVSSHYYLYELDLSKILPNYLGVIIQTGVIQEQIKAIGSTNYSRVSPKEVLEYVIPCPSIEKQKIIVEFYSKAKTNINDFYTEITHQQSLLKKLRQSILQDAISGKLTEKWRRDNPDVEPATELLARIKNEKKRLVEDKKTKKPKPLPPIAEEDIPFELPDGWVWCSVDQIGIVNRGKSPKYDKNGEKQILNQKCVRWFNIDIQHCKTVSLDWYKSLPDNIKTETNDILVNSTGEGTIGRAAIVDEKSTGLLFDSHVLRFKTCIEPTYITSLINSDFGQNQINALKGAKTTKQTELGVNNLSNLIFPLAPTVEQKTIVTKVKKLFTYSDELEQQINKSQQDSELLMQAVLKEAFE